MLKNTSGAFLLNNFGLIQVSGPDASHFLQGQLTANLNTLQAGDTVWAAHCNPKGRIISNFFLYRQDEQNLLLLLPLATIDIALNSLQKYAVFSKVTLSKVSDSYAIYGLANTYTANTAHMLHINAHLAIACYDNNTVDDTLSASSDTTLWSQLLIESGITLVLPETSDEFIPQMLNMDLLDGISFDKGCYTGQEIIARLKYKGEVKRRCFRFNLQQKQDSRPYADAPQAGTAIVDEQLKPVGVISSITHHNSRYIGLAVLKTATVAKNSPLFVQATDQASTKFLCKISDELPPYAINNK